MSNRGKGDEGLAEDLEVLADEALRPNADWDTLGPLLVRLGEELTDEERADVIAKARASTREHPDAVALLNRKIEATA